MKNKTKFLFSLVAGVLSAQVAQAQVTPGGTVLVCRSKQCAPSDKVMTREFLYNQLGSLLENNIGKSVLFCDADPNVHVCLNNAMTFDVVAGATQATVTVPSGQLLDAKACADISGYTYVMDYKMSVNDTYPECQAALNKLSIPSADNITIEVPGFECRFTENGITMMNASYQVDYIDFDYGILGAYYTLGAGQVSRGGGTGYMLMRFTNTSNDMNELRGGNCCECDSSQVPPCQCEEKEPQVVVQEKLVTEYEVAPIEVTIKTKAPIQGATTQDLKINGVVVPNVPVIVDAPAPSVETVTTTVQPGQVTVTSNKEVL